MAWSEEMFESRPVKCVVENAEIREMVGKTSGKEYKQLHVMYKPIDGTEVKGQTGCFHGFYKIFRNPDWEFAAFVRALVKLGCAPNGETDEENAKFLVGKVFTIKRTDLPLKDGDVISDVWIPIEYHGIYGQGTQNAGPAGETKKTEDSKSKADRIKQLEEMLDEGSTLTKLKRAARRDGVMTDADFEKWWEEVKGDLKEDDGLYTWK